MTIKLPEPTELTDLGGRPSGFEGYTAAQMRAYGEACAKAERERCAKVCEEQPSGFTCSEYDRACAEAAAAIRARQ